MRRRSVEALQSAGAGARNDDAVAELQRDVVGVRGYRVGAADAVGEDGEGAADAVAGGGVDPLCGVVGRSGGGLQVDRVQRGDAGGFDVGLEAVAGQGAVVEIQHIGAAVLLHRAPVDVAGSARGAEGRQVGRPCRRVVDGARHVAQIRAECGEEIRELAQLHAGLQRFAGAAPVGGVVVVETALAQHEFPGFGARFVGRDVVESGRGAIGRRGTAFVEAMDAVDTLQPAVEIGALFLGGGQAARVAHFDVVAVEDPHLGRVGGADDGAERRERGLCVVVRGDEVTLGRGHRAFGIAQDVGHAFVPFDDAGHADGVVDHGAAGVVSGMHDRQLGLVRKLPVDVLVVVEFDHELFDQCLLAAVDIRRAAERLAGGARRCGEGPFVAEAHVAVGVLAEVPGAGAEVAAQGIEQRQLDDDVLRLRVCDHLFEAIEEGLVPGVQIPLAERGVVGEGLLVRQRPGGTARTVAQTDPDAQHVEVLEREIVDHALEIALAGAGIEIVIAQLGHLGGACPLFEMADVFRRVADQRRGLAVVVEILGIDRVDAQRRRRGDAVRQHAEACGQRDVRSGFLRSDHERSLCQRWEGGIFSSSADASARIHAMKRRAVHRRYTGRCPFRNRRIPRLRHDHRTPGTRTRQ